MDEKCIMDYFDQKRNEYSLLTRNELMEWLLSKEYTEIEDLKDKIFKKRLDYFLLAKCLKEKMLRETGYKQLKRYLVYEFGMEDTDAKEAAIKYNKACWTYDSFGRIIRNVALFPNVDIRDLNINQIQLAVTEDWVRRHNAMLRGVNKRKNEELIDQNNSSVNWAEVETSFRYLQSCNWYKKAKSDPSQMAFIMDTLSSRAVSDAQHTSRHKYVKHIFALVDSIIT